MKELAKNVFAVTGLGMYSVPVFVIEVNKNELILIDAGLKKDANSILKKIETKWGSLDKIKRIVFTHRHLDHTGGLAQILEAIESENERANVEIICHEEEEQYFIKDLEELKLKPTRTLKHEEYIAKGVKIKAIHNPGHTYGHICLLIEDEKLLILGDTIMYISGVLMPVFKKFHDDYKKYKKSLPKLLDYDWEYAIPSHNRPIKISREKIKKFIKKMKKKK
ncbi:MAG: MBL fold metallo-hydrolase [Candidatus Heimdallarchaeota archaeon]